MFDARRASLRQWVQLLGGLAFYGIAITLMMRSGAGLGPWDMFHRGINRITGISVGVASEGVGFVLLFALLFARVQFGWGTIANIVLIGLVTDLTMPLVPAISPVAGDHSFITNTAPNLQHLGLQLVYYGVALVMCGLATGAYIGARMGAGPRDSLMMMLSRRTGWNVRRVRTCIELVVLLCGYLMGGEAGWGTILFALGIGPAAQWGLRLFNAIPATPPEPQLAPTATPVSIAE